MCAAMHGLRSLAPVGNEGWSYDDAAVSRRPENNERGGRQFTDTGGPLNVADKADPLTINEAF